MKRLHHSFLKTVATVGLPMLAILAVSGASSDARAASDCYVTSTVDDGDPGSLRGCVDAINAGNYDTIVFAASGVYELKYPLVLETSMTWQGNGVTISPRSSFGDPSLIVVETDASWTASDLDFDANGLHGIRAIHMSSSSSSAQLDHIQIDGFKVDGTGIGAGGALLVDGAFVSMNESSISGCSADQGGGIAVYGGTLKLTDMTLSSNDATIYGGALYSHSADNAAVKLERVQVFGNFAGVGGGIDSARNRVEMIDVLFDSNDADTGGGFHGAAEITRGVFVGNTAAGAGGGSREGGGALHTSGDVFIFASYFAGNEADDGGAIKADHNDLLEIDRTAIFENISWGQEGASALSLADADTVVTNTTIARNHALDTVQAGAAIMTYGGTLDLVHVTVAENTSLGPTTGLNVPASAQVNVSSSMFANVPNTGPAGLECRVRAQAQFTHDTSMAEGQGCPGFLSAASPAVQACGGSGNYADACEPILGIGAATCYSNIDQRGIPRSATHCSIGAIEGL